MKRACRFLCYCMVGSMGLSVKIAVLSALIEFARLGYLIATAIAVESAILHSFVWHLFWTWRDRSYYNSFSTIFSRLLRFHIANGVVGFLSNLILMRVLVEDLGLHYVPSNLAATFIAGIANFLLSEFFVFVSHPRGCAIESYGAKYRSNPIAE